MEVLEKVNAAVWGIPTLVLILGVGIYFTVATKAVQLRKFPEAMASFVRQLKKGDEKNGVSSYQALCTALAATVGTGNLAGVAGAIAIGGPGAVFWMWICGFLGMVIKYAEAVLAVHYRQILPSGEIVGGPMYMIQKGMKRMRFLGGIYCFFGVIAAFGVGNSTQIYTLTQSIFSTAASFGKALPGWFAIVLGGALGIVLVLLFLGGAGRVGKVTQTLVPAAAGAYILLCLWVLVTKAAYIPQALEKIFVGAFSPQAVTGGVVGSALITLRIGISRGVFTNEAGMGTAGIAHGSANVSDPAEQGKMGIVEVFLDTIVICSLTAFVILCADVAIPYGTDPGIELTLAAFESVLGKWVRLPITMFLCLFAFATVLGWGVYGGRCAQYIFGENAWKRFVWLQGVTAAVSAVLSCNTVWVMAEIINGCMAIPNLLAMIVLRKDVITQREKLPDRPSRRGFCRAATKYITNLPG